MIAEKDKIPNLTERNIKNNSIKFIVMISLHNVALMLSSGAVIQTFLLAFNIANTKVEFYTSYVLIFQCLAMFICSFLLDKIRNVKKSTSICRFIFPIIFISLVFVIISGIKNVDTIYVIVLLASMILNFALGFYNALYYKQPYSIIHIDGFGRVESLAGVFSGMAGIGASFLLSLFVGLFDYMAVMTVAFSVGAALWFICALLNASFKIINTEETVDKKSGSLKDFFTQPFFSKSILPTVLRGVGLGIIGLTVSIGVRDKILTTETATGLTIMTSVSTVVGSLVYFFVEKRFKHRNIMIFSGVIAGLTIPFMTVGKSVIVLYILYFIGYLCITVIATAHPVLVYDAVPYEYIGRYSAWRMLFMTFGQLIPGFFISGLYGIIGSVGIMTIGALCFLIAAILFGLIFGKRGKVPKKDAETEERG